MGAFRTLGLAFMLFAITFPYLGGQISNFGIAPQLSVNGLADMELHHLVVWDSFRAEDERKDARLDLLSTSTVTFTTANVNFPVVSAASMIKSTEIAAVNLRYNYDEFGVAINSVIQEMLGNPTRGTGRLSFGGYSALRRTMATKQIAIQKLRYALEETPATPQPTTAPERPTKTQTVEDLNLAEEVASSIEGLAFQAVNSERVAAVFLSWGMLAALAAVSIEVFQYLNWIKLGNVWRVPLLALFATLMFFMAALVYVGIEDAARQMFNDTWCIHPERHVKAEQFHALFAGDTSDRCQVSFTPNVLHVTVFMAFTFAILSFFMFTVAKVKQEWSGSDKDTSA